MNDLNYSEQVNVYAGYNESKQYLFLLMPSALNSSFMLQFPLSFFYQSELFRLERTVLLEAFYPRRIPVPSAPFLAVIVKLSYRPALLRVGVTLEFLSARLRTNQTRRHEPFATTTIRISKRPTPNFAGGQRKGTYRRIFISTPVKNSPCQGSLDGNTEFIPVCKIQYGRIIEHVAVFFPRIDKHYREYLVFCLFIVQRIELDYRMPFRNSRLLSRSTRRLYSVISAKSFRTRL